MLRAYRAPPITEAVIEFQFRQPVSMDVVNKISGRLAGNYVFQDHDKAVNFLLDPNTETSKTNSLWQGVRHSSVDRADISVIRTVAFAASRLAPYTTWEDFSARVERDWDIVRKSDVCDDLIRVGTRFINRIDILDSPEAPKGINDYLTIFPVMPASKFGSINSYFLQVSRQYGSKGLIVILNSALGASPLLGHSALVLDIDVSFAGQVPRRKEELWHLLGEMRDCKNDVFEECITDLTRELIS